jgi:6-phosphofructokinase 1
MTKRIGVLTGGGDCPGLNPAIKGLVLGALWGGNSGQKYEVIGLRDGWRGLVQEDLPERRSTHHAFFGPEDYWKVLTQEEVEQWDTQGGTNLGSSRTNPFSPKAPRQDVVVKNIEAMKLDALVAIGGEDTLGVAAKLHHMGVPVVGIPKTIDKDLVGTDYTLGFETAVQIITEEVDRIRTTAGSHSRTFIIETMGRHAGHLALQGGIASGAYVILIPEHRFNLGRVIRLLVERRMKGIRYSIVLVSEGAYADTMDGPYTTGSIRDTGFDHVALGGIGDWLRHEIEQATDYDLRSVVLSHLQRGGAPCAYDRRIGGLFGRAAADLVRKGHFGEMVSLRKGRISHVPLTDVEKGLLTVDVDREYDASRYNGKRAGLIGSEVEND